MRMPGMEPTSRAADGHAVFRDGEHLRTLRYRLYLEGSTTVKDVLILLPAKEPDKPLMVVSGNR